MSKTHVFDCGDGVTVRLNSLQLMGLLQLPASNASWSTYYALRKRGLIEGASPQRLTSKGVTVIENYKNGR